MATVIILLLVGILVGFAIWWFFFKKDKKKETEVTIKADGTITESFVPYPSQLTEYFVYDTNEVSTRAPAGETVTITENDPYEFLYYKSSKTDRPTIWEGSTFVPWDRYRDCPSTEGCVKFNALNKELMEMMINDANEHLAPFPRKYREYLVSVNLETPDKMNAKYKEYVPGGYSEYAGQMDSNGRPTNMTIVEKDLQFQYDILLKGYADFLNITFPNFDDFKTMNDMDQMAALNAVSPALTHLQMFIKWVTLGLIYIKDNKIHIKINPNNPEVSLLIGHDMAVVIFVFWITVIKELSGVHVKKLNYEIPSEVKTFKQINDSFNAKKRLQMGIGS